MRYRNLSLYSCATLFQGDKELSKSNSLCGFCWIIKKRSRDTACSQSSSWCEHAKYVCSAVFCACLTLPLHVEYFCGRETVDRIALTPTYMETKLRRWRIKYFIMVCWAWCLRYEQPRFIITDIVYIFHALLCSCTSIDGKLPHRRSHTGTLKEEVVREAVPRFSLWPVAHLGSHWKGTNEYERKRVALFCDAFMRSLSPNTCTFWNEYCCFFSSQLKGDWCYLYGIVRRMSRISCW